MNSRFTSKIVTIEYTNYRNERKTYKVAPKSIRFTATEQHLEPQWVMFAEDVERRVFRAFAMKDIHSWVQETNAGSTTRMPIQE